MHWRLSLVAMFLAAIGPTREAMPGESQARAAPEGERSTGTSYQNTCYFKGWVDYVCPRSWLYVTNSQFVGHNEPSASIWHDGSLDRTQKFVIRQSRFEGVPGVPLGRNHRDGPFYLLDAEFSENMADRPIYPASPPESYKWSQRYCHAVPVPSTPVPRTTQTKKENS